LFCRTLLKLRNRRDGHVCRRGIMSNDTRHGTAKFGLPKVADTKRSARPLFLGKGGDRLQNWDDRSCLPYTR
jgi:hypothetical protein